MRTLLRRCLTKDRRQRLDSAAVVRLEIDDALRSIAGGATVSPQRWRSRATSTMIFAATGAIVVVTVLIWLVTRAAPPTSVVPSRFAIEPPITQPLNMSSNDRDLALSPDGRYLVYRGGGSGTSGSPLFVRALDQLDARLLYAGGAYGPFFSPDGRWVGFFEASELKRVSIMGGPAVTICRVNGSLLGASWADNDTVIFATDDARTGLWRVNANGGEPTAITTPELSARRVDRFPSVLPGGRAALVTLASAGRAENSEVAMVDLRTGERKTLVRGGTQAEYFRTDPGRQTGALVYAMAGSLRAVPFDLTRLEPLGDPVAIEEHLLTKASGAVNYAVSQTGTLVYVPAGTGGIDANRSLVWVDRKGGEQPINAPVRAYGSSARVSPDGTRVALLINEGQDYNLWIWDLAHETLRRVTFATVGRSSTRNIGPVWTPDSRRILFSSDREGVLNLYSQAADGTGVVDRITTSPNRQWVSAVTPDGSRAIGYQITSATKFDIVAYSLHGPSTVEPLVQTAADEMFPELSPDGRYLAYQSNESGKFEIYVRRYPDVDSARWQISTNGGTRVAWARNGSELFYFDESNTFTAVSVQATGSTLVVGRSTKLFDTTPYFTQNPSRTYDLSVDGQRFLWPKNVTGGLNSTAASMIVVEHWLEESKSSPASR
jgi:serine/threonine-protein kinase